MEIAVTLDGDGLVADMQATIKANGWRVSGQCVRRDGVPVLFIAHDVACIETAKRMAKKPMEVYHAAV